MTNAKRQQERRVERVGKLEGALRLQRDKLAGELRDGYEQSAQWTQNKIDRLERELAEQA